MDTRSAAADHGHGGTALVFSTTRPIVTGRARILLDSKNVTVLHSDPRLLLVRLVATCGMRLLCVVGHAPHQGQPDHVKRTWWKQVIRLVGAFLNNDPCLLLFLDANADVGHPPVAGRVGPFQSSLDTDTNGLGLGDLPLLKSITMAPQKHGSVMPPLTTTAGA